MPAFSGKPDVPLSCLEPLDAKPVAGFVQRTPGIELKRLCIDVAGKFLMGDVLAAYVTTPGRERHRAQDRTKRALMVSASPLQAVLGLGAAARCSTTTRRLMLPLR